MQARGRLVQEHLPKAALVVPHGNFTYVDEAGPGGLPIMRVPWPGSRPA